MLYRRHFMQPLRRDTSKHDYRAELFELIRTRSSGAARSCSPRAARRFLLRPAADDGPSGGATCVGELICDVARGTKR